MTELTIPGFRAEANIEATRAWYAHEGDEWNCMCGHCRNFVKLAKARQLPPELLGLLDRLGIPPEKAVYVCEYYEKDGRLLYDVTWNVAGKLLEESAESQEELPWGGWRMRACRDSAYPAEWFAGFPEPWFQLEANIWLPWALDEPIDTPRPSEHYIPVTGGTGETAAFLRQVISAALAAEGVDFACEVDVKLTGDGEIREINRDMRGVDRPTDVLSFPCFELAPGELPDPEEDMEPGTGYVPLGDMAISMDRVRAQAAEYGHSEQRELAYLAVHSVLHLLGYDHLDDGPMKAQMRSREEAILAQLGITRE